MNTKKISAAIAVSSPINDENILKAALPGDNSVTAETPIIDDEQATLDSHSRIYADNSRNIPFLRIIYPREQPQRIRLAENSMMLGRSSAADIVLRDNQISRMHCKVTYANGKIFIEDLGSTNGTLIDGVPIKLASLALHSRLQIGRFVLKAEFKDPDEISYDDKILAAATTDPLTGIPNRRWLLEQGASFLRSFKGPNHCLSAVMIDVDHFKSINDRFGHQTGDEVLRDIAHTLQHNKRELDLLGRYGGEEFLMFLPHTAATEALPVCERLRHAIELSEHTLGDTTGNISVSIGLASTASAETNSLDELIKQADIALYHAKQNGRNRVEPYGK